MKKALALVLALVLALSMAVSAFAATLDDLTVLKPVKPAAPGLKPLNTIDLEDKTEAVAIAGEGGTYYVVLDFAYMYKNVTVTANGAISAKVVEYDPDVYEPIGETYAVVNALGELAKPHLTGLTYKVACEKAEYMNDAEETTEYKVVCEQDIVLIELVIADNYTASYKEGVLKVTADRSTDGKTWEAVAGKWTVIRDVTIFEYEQVKWAAADEDNALRIGEEGYSDYVTAMLGYDLNKDSKYQSSELRGADKATVISTTAFRAIEGKDITVEIDHKNDVTIYDVAKGQKGVNFEFYGYEFLNAKGQDITLATTLDKQLASIAFGFYGDQVIASDFTITLNPGVTYFELRELFGIKVEEDDIITYYLLKDGKVAQEITVDYMTVDLSKEMVLELKGSNTTLGQYELVLDVASDAETEENPNTGAESVVGVVAALAVVSVATAAAVSLKK